jgi:sulfoacetaldehyde acetyltransferase
MVAMRATTRAARHARLGVVARRNKATAAATVNGAEDDICGVPTLMTNSEAFVETLRVNGVKDVFGIVGSAFMDSLDLFPRAGIRFISVAHEQNAAHMADGYYRASGKTGTCIGQNGPGISNFVTGVAAAYWANSPMVVITPEAATMTKGHGGFQEVDQLPMFSTVCKDQVHVNNGARMAELTGLAYNASIRELGPVQLNIPRDFFYGQNTFTVPRPQTIEPVAGGETALQQAAELIRGAKNPVIISGGGVVQSEGGVAAVVALAEALGAPVASTYLHNDSFPHDHPLSCGPLGYCGSKGAMTVVSEADVLICVGTRLGPFGTNPQYGFNYWPNDAKVVQVEIDPKRVGRVKALKQDDVGICGDAALAAKSLVARLSAGAEAASVATKADRFARISEHKVAWEAEVQQMLVANQAAAEAEPGRLVPRQVLRELEKAMPEDAMVATDIGNSCSVSNGFLKFKEPRSYFAAMTYGNCGYALPAVMGAKVACPDRPAVAYVGDGAWGMSLNETLTCIRENIPTTTVVFNNRQWGAEKKNQVLWFGDRYLGVQLEHPDGGFAGIAKAMGAEGVQVTKLEDVGPALQAACAAQKEGKTTIVEIMTTRELGDPFRRDAMKLPQRLLSKYQATNESAESATQQPIDLGKDAAPDYKGPDAWKF